MCSLAQQCPAVANCCRCAGSAWSAHLGGDGPAHNAQDHQVGDALGGTQSAACAQAGQQAASCCIMQQAQAQSRRTNPPHHRQLQDTRGACKQQRRQAAFVCVCVHWFAPGPGGRPAPVVFSVHLGAGRTRERNRNSSGHPVGMLQLRQPAQLKRSPNSMQQQPRMPQQPTNSSWHGNGQPSRIDPGLTRTRGTAGWQPGPGQSPPCRRCRHPRQLPLHAPPGGPSAAAARRAGLRCMGQRHG